MGILVITRDSIIKPESFSSRAVDDQNVHVIICLSHLKKLQFIRTIIYRGWTEVFVTMADIRFVKSESRKSITNYRRCVI